MKVFCATLWVSKGDVILADDIEEVRRTEEQRGRRPKDAETIEERRRMSTALREIWNNGDVEDLKAVMREYGLFPESPEWTATLQTWSHERGRT
jgi:hypothetical protein